MLALSRRKLQRIQIGSLGSILICETRGDKTKLGFDFPRSLPIHRDEVFKKLPPHDIASATAEVLFSVAELYGGNLELLADEIQAISQHMAILVSSTPKAKSA
jgi:carbon storage regulator